MILGMKATWRGTCGRGHSPSRTSSLHDRHMRPHEGQYLIYHANEWLWLHLPKEFGQFMLALRLSGLGSNTGREGGRNTGLGEFSIIRRVTEY